MTLTMTSRDVDRKFKKTDRKFKKADCSFKELRLLMKETDRQIKETERIVQENALQMKETDRQMKETDRKMQETDRQMKETDRQMKETDRKMQETDRQMKETDRKMQETDRQMKMTERMIQENAMQMKETGLKMQETDRIVKAVSLQIGKLGSRWGEFVEGLVAPAAIAMFTQRGIPVDEIYLRVKKTVAGERMEIDILVANTIAVVLIEVKSNLQIEDVRHHLKRLERFKILFTRYANCQVYGAVAGIAMSADAYQFAVEQGLFVIVQSGDTVKLANELEFIPKIW